MTTKNVHPDFVKWMLYDEVIKFGGPFTLKDGRESSFYINMRDMISDPVLFEGTVNAIGNIAFANFFQDSTLRSLPHRRYLMGIPEAATEYAGAIGYEFSLPLLKRRVKQKTYGEPRPIEGQYHAGDDVVLIDDVISSAKSKVDEAELLSLHGLNTAGVAVLVDRQQGGRTELAERGIDFVAAFTISSIAKFAFQHEKIGKIVYDQVISELDPNEI